MRRYFSHYTYIHPNIYLKNHIVELDDEYHILKVFPFEKEIERTEFYSGILIFIPQDKKNDIDLGQIEVDSFNNRPAIDTVNPLNKPYTIIYKELT